jgi:hypothetical protein
MKIINVNPPFVLRQILNEVVKGLSGLRSQEIFYYSFKPFNRDTDPFRPVI